MFTCWSALANYDFPEISCSSIYYTLSELKFCKLSNFYLKPNTSALTRKNLSNYLISEISKSIFDHQFQLYDSGS